MECPIAKTMDRVKGGGRAVLSYGFRPFFFFGALYAAAAILLWLLMLRGTVTFEAAFSPRDWHIHEMLFGFVPAVMTGFLLTAIPNWTGRLPLRGGPLLALISLWMAGRIAVALSAEIGWWPAAVIDGSFLLAVAAAAAREIAAGKNYRNLPVVAMVAFFAAANAAFHLEAHFGGGADVSVRAGIAMIVLLMSLIGGRIIPSFTLNWLTRMRARRAPAAFGRFDKLALATGAAALVAWIALGNGPFVAVGLIAAGALHAGRLARWSGFRTWREPLLLVLHIAYGFVPLGFVLTGLAAAGWLAASAGTHAWTAGAIGLMTLAIMSRASLGHTGRTLRAAPATQFVYAAALAGAVARIAAALEPTWSEALVALSGVAWAGAFLGFSVIYAPVLWSARKGP